MEQWNNETLEPWNSLFQLPVVNIYGDESGNAAVYKHGSFISIDK